MIKADDILNKNIVTVKEGRQINKIKEIFIDKNQFEIKYLFLDKLEKILDFADITSISENNIVIQSEEKLKDMNLLNDKENLIEYSALKKLKIISEKGLEIGKIQAVFVKKENGKITHYEIAETPISEHSILSQEGILSIGQDVIIISETAFDISKMMKSKSGFLNIFKKLFVKTKKKSEKAKDKLEELKVDIGKNMGKIVEATHMTIYKTKPKIQKISDKIKNIIKSDKKDKQ